jgi:hypothetical protein
MSGALWQCVASTLALVVGACRPDISLVAVAAAESVTAKTAPAAQEVRVVERIKLELGTLVGLSGLTTDGNGTLWTVPERQRYLVPLKLDGPEPGIAGSAIPLVGVPTGLDTESIGWVKEQEFVLGTESQVANRKTDRVFLVRVAGGVARVFDEIVLPYTKFGLRPRGNQGLEAICVVGDTIVVGLESVVESRPPRWAHLFRASLEQRVWEPFRLRLTTATGKLSALECRRDGEGLFAIGIERHYGVARLLSFHLPLTGQGGDIAPTTLADLAAQVPGVPNMEGIAWRRSGEVAIIIDNDTGGITGPTEVFIVTGPDL